MALLIDSAGDYLIDSSGAYLVDSEGGTPPATPAPPTSMRTTEERVRIAVETDEAVDVQQYIETAHSITNIVAQADSQGLLSEGLLTIIETYLAAHYYTLYDPQYLTKTTGDAQASFAKRDWWNEAAKLDLTGTLARMASGNHRGRVVWLGGYPADTAPFWIN